MDLAQEVERLRKIPMFSKVDTSKLKLLAFTSQLLQYRNGEPLFHINDPADSVYLVMQGEVEIITESDCGAVSSIIRGEGELIGEMAVISQVGRSATVQAKGDAVVLRIEDDAFLGLLSSNPEVALDVMRQLSHKLAQAQQQNNQLQKQLAGRSQG